MHPLSYIQASAQAKVQVGSTDEVKVRVSVNHGMDFSKNKNNISVMK